jgi:hypothetical protein
LYRRETEIEASRAYSCLLYWLILALQNTTRCPLSVSWRLVDCGEQLDIGQSVALGKPVPTIDSAPYPPAG